MIADGKSKEVAKLLREAEPLIPFVIGTIAHSYELSDPRAREAAFAAVKQFLSSLSQIMQDSYIPTAATLLGVSPALFSRGAVLSEVRRSFTQKKEDIALLSLFKTLLEKPMLIDEVLDVLDSSMFGEYQSLFEALVREEQDHPQLVGLSIDENIQTLSEEELRKSLLWMLSLYYREQYREIAKDNTLSYQKKSFLMRKIKTDIIPRLKRGELVAYESFGTV